MLRASLIAGFLLVANAVMPAAWALPGYRMHQVSDFYGETIAEVSPKSLRLQSSRLQLTLHVASPKFAMTAVNDKNRQYSEVPLEEWMGFVMNQRGPVSGEYMVKRGSTRICGYDADEYWIETRSRASLKSTAPKDLFYKGRSYNTHYWVARSIKPPMKSYEIFTNALGVPAALGFPLRMIQYSADGRAFTTFDTKRVEHANVIEKLAVPPGYTKAADEMALLVSGADTSGIASLLADDGILPKRRSRARSDADCGTAARQRCHGWVPGMDATADEAPVASKRTRGLWTPGG